MVSVATAAEPSCCTPDGPRPPSLRWSCQGAAELREVSSLPEVTQKVTSRAGLSPASVRLQSLYSPPSHTVPRSESIRPRLPAKGVGPLVSCPTRRACLPGTTVPRQPLDVGARARAALQAPGERAAPCNPLEVLLFISASPLTPLRSAFALSESVSLPILWGVCVCFGPSGPHP